VLGDRDDDGGPALAPEHVRLPPPPAPPAPPRTGGGGADDFTPGDLVTVLTGPFINCTGEVLGVEPDGPLVQVLANVMGRQTPVEVDAQDLLKHT
jgi:hypothetical protein